MESSVLIAVEATPSTEPSLRCLPEPEVSEDGEHHDHEADDVKNVVHVLPPFCSSPCDRFVRFPDVAPLRESTHRGGSDRNPSSEPITGLPRTLTGPISIPKWT